jgi:hypothetical protein
VGKKKVHQKVYILSIAIDWASRQRQNFDTQKSMGENEDEQMKRKNMRKQNQIDKKIIIVEL